MTQPARFPSVRCVLFDLDGTLVDSAPDLGLAADAMRVARGLESLPEAAYRPHAGSGARGMLRVALGATPDQAGFNDLRDEFFSHYERRLTARTAPFAGVLELIAALQARGLAWGIVTNKSTRFSAPLVAATPVLQTAGVVVSGNTTPHTKPHPAPILHALASMGVPPQESLYVGDDARDMIAGKAAGVGTVAALYGYLGDAHPDTWAADARIQHPLELLKLLNPA